MTQYRIGLLASGHVQVGTETRSYRFVPLPWQATFGGSEP